MEERESTFSGSPENTDSGLPTPTSGSGYGGGGSAPPGIGGATLFGGGGGVYMGKRRGRPRKYDPEGNLNPAYAAAAERKAERKAALAVAPPGFTLTMPVNSGGPKRGRGKSSLSGNWQQLAPLGDIFANSAGGDFIPYAVTVQTGEDVAAMINSFCKKGPRGVCILSAVGVISNVTIRQPGSSARILTYEGQYEILSLNGSYTVTDSGGAISRSGGLSITLAGPDGRVVGGSVAGWLTAASPTQVIIGSFAPGGIGIGIKPKRKYQYHNRESSNAAAIPAIPESVAATNPSLQMMSKNEAGAPAMFVMPAQSPNEGDDSLGSGHNHNIGSSHNTPVWNDGSERLSDHRNYPDINVSVPGV